jgi:hypothetical protein
MAAVLKYIIEAKDKSGKATKSASASLDGLTDKVKSAGLALGAAFAADQLADMAKMGATAERVERRFAAFSQEAGGAEQVLAAFQKGAGGAASKMEGMASASKLLQMGLVQDAAGMERVVEMASRMGDQTQGVTDRVADFSLMLANTSIPRLDNFGISSGRVRTRIAELQEATKGMTREAAFMQAVMEEGGDALTKLGPRVDDNLMSFEKMEAQMADLKVEIGQGLAPVMVTLMGVVSSLLTAVSPLIDKFAELTSGVEEMERVIATNEQVATSYGDQLNALVDSGMSMSDALGVLGGKLDDAATEWDNMSAAERIAVDLMGKGSEYTHSMGRAVTSLNEAIASGSSSYADYTSAIEQYNSGVTKSESKIDAMTQAEYKRQKQWELGAAGLEDYEKQALGTMAAVVEQYGEYTWANHQAYTAEQKRIELSRQQLEAAQMNATELANVTAETESYDRSLMNLTASQQAGILVTDEQEIAQKNLTHSIQQSAEQAAAMEEKAQRVGEMQAASAAASAAALQAQAAAADEAARAQGALMTQMTGATIEMVKQKTFAAIDPAEIGIEAYATLGQELGVLDEKAANLAVGIPTLAQAYMDGIVPTENMAEATTALFEAAGDADFNVGALLDKYAAAPGLIGPSKEALDSFNEKIEKTAEIVPDATGNVDGLGVAASDTKDSVSGLTDEVSELEGELIGLTAQDWVINVKVNMPSDIGSPSSGIPRYQYGGIHPGTPGGPHTLAWMAPGERAVPQGMSVGPYGPPVNHVTNNTYHVPSMLAAKMLANQQSMARRARFEGR